VFWTFDRGTDRYLNVHARSSADRGRTWGELWDTGVAGQPARAIALADGRLLMTYVDRTDAPAIKCRTSEDGGHTWPAATELLIHRREQTRSQTWDKRSMQDAWAEMSAFSVGIPDAVALPGESGEEPLVVYYSGGHPDLTDVCWAHLRAD
jgi:poly(3-hydroxybutyrate) depolymerase